MLSILVPVYNTERYLSRCIDSIISQSYHEIELILVDDGSTDSSGQICDEYARKYSHIHVIHKKNSGLGSARIAGIESSCGEYVAFIDSDDYVEYDMYEKLMLPFLKDQTVDISIGGYVMENVDDSLICPFTPAKQRVYPASLALSDMFANIIFNWSLCDKVYRRDLFKNSFSLQEWPKDYGEDTFVNWQMFQRAHNIAYVPIYGYHYCIHGGSMTQQIFSEKMLSYLDIWDQILDDAKASCYAHDIIRIMLDFGFKYIACMQKNWDCYKKTIDNYRAMLHKHITKYNYPMNLSERWKLGMADRSQIDYLVTIQMLEDNLLRFSSSFQHIFIYGTGIIANEIAVEMERSGNEYDGFVVSKIRKKEDFFYGKPVLEVQDLNFSIENVGFILALNRSNEEEVIKLLKSMGYKNMYSAGKTSYFYV